MYEERWRIGYGLATMELAGFGKSGQILVTKSNYRRKPS